MNEGSGATRTVRELPSGNDFGELWMARTCKIKFSETRTLYGHKMILTSENLDSATVQHYH